MTVVLATQGVGFAYGDNRVLDDVTFDVNAGEFVALAGANGAGKSTLLRVILGLLRPERGTVRLLGDAPSTMSQRWRIGYVPQRSCTHDTLPATVVEVVAAGRLARRGWWRFADANDRRAVDEALAAVQLDDLHYHRYTELSGGQQQRVLIAKAIVNDPEILILDEPIAGVDVAAQAHFRDALVSRTAKGRAVLLVSHELSAVAADLDRVVLLRQGTVGFDGPPSGLEREGINLGVHRHDLPAWLEDQT
ncbi:MAG: hypothetical protein QOF21_1899 [Actinomycetota bacterium]